MLVILGRSFLLLIILSVVWFACFDLFLMKRELSMFTYSSELSPPIVLVASAIFSIVLVMEFIELSVL